MKVLEEVPDSTVVTPEQFALDPKAAVRDADGLIVRSAVQADAALIEAAGNMRVIGRAGVGVDNIDVETATRRGIVVMNAPGASAVSVAELTLGLMLAMARHIPRADVTTRGGQWDKKNLQGTELAGKTLGIVGLGRIGTESAQRARAFGMNLIGSDPYLSPSRAKELGIELVSLDELYAQADYISLHLALSHQTANMINAEAIARMKPGVRLVNCARGELVDEAAVEAALRSGHIAAAALDVFREEPPVNSGLLSAPNLVATPHLGASTREGQEAVGIQIARQVRDYLLDGIAQNAVNLPSLSDVEYQQIKPYMALAAKLGRFAAQLFASNLEEIEVRFQGEVGGWKTQLIRSAAVAAILRFRAPPVRWNAAVRWCTAPCRASPASTASRSNPIWTAPSSSFPTSMSPVSSATSEPCWDGAASTLPASRSAARTIRRWPSCRWMRWSLPRYLQSCAAPPR